MGKIARIHAKKNYCANDVIPAYESYYKRVLAESGFSERFLSQW